ncbi:sialidase family protein [Persicitalea jodogahamensis]|uniref:Sialidase domain-containing protein n=1 Tax=Persicitalea jodogahamensis TaxID=402147 RepID=A0A8J3GBA2_9BACT|nr:sialidase family protein [Persicitalea jodogahamensis]GHB80594.1 hypothetical protein GCM10007390_38720 [Persicitalea jodogahamensis]
MLKSSLPLYLLFSLLAFAAAPGHSQSNFPGSKVSLVSEEFVYETAPFPSCHASTLVEVAPGQWLSSWFGGTDEGNKDVGIWLSQNKNGKWTPPKLMAEGVIDANTRYPCWNPVLFKSQEGKVFLFYKVGPSPREWWGMLRTSTDNGNTWSQPERLPEGVLGPIKNKPVQLADGTILSPSSTETRESWKAHIERSVDSGKTWEILAIDPKTEYDVIQGSVLTYPNQKLQMLCRTKQDRIAAVWSEDNGKTWGDFTLTNLPNPNSGTDAVTLSNGWQMLVHNPVTRGKQSDNGRQKLVVSLSEDGKKWKEMYVLEDQYRGEFSYPAIVQAADGTAHITYTWNRKKIRHVVLKLEK